VIPHSASLCRVLIADDDHGVRRSLATALSRAGFEVTAVDDGEPAIALAGSAAFDIVIVDLHMRTGGLAVIPTTSSVTVPECIAPY
jgi:two-component system cell cycle response regulator